MGREAKSCWFRLHWIRMWKSSKMELKDEAVKIEAQPIRRYQLVCCDVGETLESKALPCGPCGETVWTVVTSSTSTFGMLWFLTCAPSAETSWRRSNFPGPAPRSPSPS